ncbi:hypothetical protein [Halopiger goleimassiliensis]|uniref:hypothetical protein n=1 Tax=Halopiger goleimassiliensis TaxID=1293048 RepID=UPI000677803D|nr:hypothetical protein [Halopiger goleimassiliensis]
MTDRYVVAVALLSVALALVAAGPVAAGVGSPADAGQEAGPAVVVADESVAVDDTQRHRVALTDAPEGLAGFELTLEVDGEVATVADAAYPDHFGPTTDPVVTADERSITVEAVDLDDEITTGETDVTLAWIDVTGVAAGETELRVTASQVDADDGSPVDPTVDPGTLTVGTVDGDADSVDDADGDSGPADEASDAADESDATDSIPGFAVGTTLAALVVASLLAAGRLRPR